MRSIAGFLFRLFLSLPFIVAAILGIFAVAILSLASCQTD